MTSNQLKRRFKIWDYNISHSQMLIRSPKDDENNTNVDIKFIGVSYVNLPTVITDILFLEPSIEEISKITFLIQYKPEKDKIFVLSSLDNRYIIVAKSCEILEHKLDIFETTLECFGHETEKLEQLKRVRPMID